MPLISFSLGSLLSAVATALGWDSLCLQQDLYRLICHFNCHNMAPPECSAALSLHLSMLDHLKCP